MTHRIALPGAAPAFGALALAACAPAGSPGQPAPAPGEPDRPMQDCQALDTRSWQAWIDRMPGPGGPADTLHVTGEAQYPAASWEVSLRIDRVLESAPPILVLQMIESPPDGMAAQVLTWEALRFEAEADAQGYRAVRIECGPEAVAEISPVAAAY